MFKIDRKVYKIHEKIKKSKIECCTLLKKERVVSSSNYMPSSVLTCSRRLDRLDLFDLYLLTVLKLICD